MGVTPIHGDVGGVARDARSEHRGQLFTEADSEDLPGCLANRVVLEALSGIARSRIDARDETRWNPSQPLLGDPDGAARSLRRARCGSPPATALVRSAVQRLPRCRDGERRSPQLRDQVGSVRSRTSHHRERRFAR